MNQNHNNRNPVNIENPRIENPRIVNPQRIEDPRIVNQITRTNSAILNNAIIDLGTHQKLQQCTTAYYKLPPVPKKVYTGSRGGLYYISQTNQKQYIAGPKRIRLMENRLKGVIGNINLDPGILAEPAFQRVENRLRNL